MEHKRVESIGFHGIAAAGEVRKRRESASLTLAEVARRTGGQLNELAIRRVENLARRIDVDDLFRLASALGTNVSTMLGLSAYVQTGSLAPEDLEQDAAERRAFEALPDEEQWRVQKSIEDDARGMSGSERAARDELENLVASAPKEIVGELLAIVRRLVPIEGN